MKPSVVYGLKLGAAAVLAGAGVLSAGAAALTLGGGSDLMNLATVHDNRAEARLEAVPPDPDVAAAETRAALAQAPMNPGAWARLAYIDRSRSTVLTPAALDNLERSYAVAPFGPDITRWRVRFMFEHWGELTPSLRTQASDELRVLSRYRGGVARDVVRTIENPSGRLAAEMIRSLGQADARRDQEAREAAEAAKAA